MQFTSVPFLLLLALTVVVYYALPSSRLRQVWLLAASLAFYYSMSVKWTLLLLGVTAFGYVAGISIDAARKAGMPRRARGLMTAGVVGVIGTLLFFKYHTLAASLGNAGLGFLGIDSQLTLASIALPIGISFWTFQTVAYVVDVYRGDLEVERDPLAYAVFISFFPHVSAGPIARGSQLLPQLSVKHGFTHTNLRSGLVLMAWGFFKKLVVADAFAVIVDTVFSDPRAFGHNGALMAGAALAFSIQIYCDFSGYTDIARGAARLFGIELLQNFSRPYLSRSVKEFWRRWHMTLMSWLKDYVYIPLGGSRVPVWRRYLNVLIVFLISGAWHGAGLTFIVWGGLNAVYQIVGDLTAPVRARARGMLGLSSDGTPLVILQTLITFLLITVAWVFFRAESLGDAFYILRMGATAPYVRPTTDALIALGLPLSQLAAAVAGAVVVLGADIVGTRVDVGSAVFRLPMPIRWFAYQMLMLSIVIFGYYGSTYSAADFAYFKF